MIIFPFDCGLIYSGDCDSFWGNANFRLDDYFRYRMMEETEREGHRAATAHALILSLKYGQYALQTSARWTQSAPTGIFSNASVVCSGSFVCKPSCSCEIEHRLRHSAICPSQSTPLQSHLIAFREFCKSMGGCRAWKSESRLLPAVSIGKRCVSLGPNSVWIEREVWGFK